jgi:hypothetical protein
MKCLIHICCAPCAIYPVDCLKSQQLDVMGYFCNPNIHPYQEFNRRKKTLVQYASHIDLRVIYENDYPLEQWIQNITFRETDRCKLCYYDRLKSTAIIARKGKFHYFTTTLLYSKFQNHELISEMGKNLEKKYGVSFFYSDFRKGWKQGIELSKKLNLYRQEYCGCIYSEKERYYKL